MQKSAETVVTNPPLRVKELGFGQRHVQAFLAFIVVVVLYVIRVSMSAAIIAMTDIADNRTHVEVYDWSKQTQDLVLSAFFWGYTIMQIPSGCLAHKYGAKVLLLAALVVNGSISIILPYIVSFFGWKGAFLSRVAQGLSQSCLMPSVHTILSKWAPVNERARFGNFIIGGATFGAIVSMPTMGFLCSHYGWSVAFQFIGGLSFATAMVIFWFGSNSPAELSYISAEERNYIEMSLGHTGEKKAMKTPWKSFLTSKPLIALILAQTGMNWGFVVMLLEIPSYFKMALGINTKESGIYSALPYISVWLMGFVISYLIDKGINKGLFGITAGRKIASCFTGIGCAVGFAILSFIPTSQVLLSIIVLTITVGFLSGTSCGVMLNPVDLAPNFAGIIMATMNCVANAVGTQASITAGMILTDPYDISQWRIVLNMTGGIMAISAVIFLFFGSGEKQPWNDPPESQDPESRIRQEDAHDEKELMK